ncbi:MAG: M20 aminoacylase family protein [Roseiarcus sp.]
MGAEILERIGRYQPELIEIRRDIHRHPEIGFEETRASALVARKLREWGVDVVEGLAKTGVVGTVEGATPGPRAIGLRADMDALHIEETPGREHGSTVRGKMHACGHDGHTAMLPGAARYLSENRDFKGTVHLIFQPAEEGLGGGAAMVKEGLFERFPVDAVYGMHNVPGLPVGMFVTRKGAMLAAADKWTATFRGSGGHGGESPHLASDATLAMAQFITSLQTIVSRSVPPGDTAVVSVGHVGGGSPDAFNIMPARVVVPGTARSFKPAIRDLIERRLGELAAASATAFGCSAVVDYEHGEPALVTHAEQTEVSVRAARALVGERAVITDMQPSTGGEDFAYMLEARPGGLMGIGNGVDADGSCVALHRPDYDFNDTILTLGAAFSVSLAHEELGG